MGGNIPRTSRTWNPTRWCIQEPAEGRFLPPTAESNLLIRRYSLATMGAVLAGGLLISTIPQLSAVAITLYTTSGQLLCTIHNWELFATLLIWFWAVLKIEAHVIERYVSFLYTMLEKNMFLGSQ